MREESPQSFPRPDPYELIYEDIDSELQKAGIRLERTDSDRPNNTCTITTDKKVPEEVMSSIRQYADYKGITIKFLTSG